MILLGPSGCGKSTTLRMIAGLESDHRAATLRIGGRAVNDVDPARPRPRLRVPELRALSAYDGARQPGLRPASSAACRRARDRAPDAASVATMLGIGRAARPQAARSSRAGSASGWRSGRALVREPVAFLLDEPLSNLDAKLRAAMRTELVKLHRQLGTHHRPCHPRPGRGHDHGRAHLHHARRRRRPGRRADGGLSQSGSTPSSPASWPARR